MADLDPSATSNELDELLSRLSSPLVSASGPSPVEAESTDAQLGPTLMSLLPERRPHPLPACAVCPRSMWLASTGSLKCFCRVMHAISWTAEEPQQSILLCDGILLGNE